mmetsp:Transcript_33418/g.69590  ORF Transcript_33418/g.69590 Transcript_33418/m.69590 type:complete len:206 (+) Transcript_33418:143-760(+)
MRIQFHHAQNHLFGQYFLVAIQPLDGFPRSHNGHDQFKVGFNNHAVVIVIIIRIMLISRDGNFSQVETGIVILAIPSGMNMRHGRCCFDSRVGGCIARGGHGRHGSHAKPSSTLGSTQPQQAAIGILFVRVHGVTHITGAPRRFDGRARSHVATQIIFLSIRVMFIGIVIQKRITFGHAIMLRIRWFAVVGFGFWRFFWLQWDNP